MFDPVKSFPIIFRPQLSRHSTPMKMPSEKTKTEPHLLLVGGKKTEKTDRSRKKRGEKDFRKDLLPFLIDAKTTVPKFPSHLFPSLS